MGRPEGRDGRQRRVPVTALAAAIALLAAAARPTPAVAQRAGSGPAGLEVDAGAALLAPLADLTAGGDTGGGLQLSNSAGLRAGGVWWVGSRLAVGVGGSWVPVDVQRLAGADPEGDPVPGVKVADADLLLGSVEAVLVLPAVGEDVQVEPFLVGGAGLRRLSVEGDGPPSATDPMVAVGGGFRTSLSDRWHLRLEARDHLSAYDAGGGEGRTQHDLSISVGVGVRP